MSKHTSNEIETRIKIYDISYKVLPEFKNTFILEHPTNIEQLWANVGGVGYRLALATQGKELSILMRSRVKRFPKLSVGNRANDSRELILGMPRAGLATAVGVACVLDTSELHIANCGLYKNTSLPIFPNDIHLYEDYHLVVVDEGIATGQSLSELLLELKSRFSKNMPKIDLIVNFANRQGLKFLNTLHSDIINGIYCAYYLTDSQYYFPIRTSVTQAPKYLFIDKPRESGEAGIGDCGDMVEEGLEHFLHSDSTEDKSTLLYQAINYEIRKLI